MLRRADLRGGEAQGFLLVVVHLLEPVLDLTQPIFALRGNANATNTNTRVFESQLLSTRKLQHQQDSSSHEEQAHVLTHTRMPHARVDSRPSESVDKKSRREKKNGRESAHPFKGLGELLIAETVHGLVELLLALLAGRLELGQVHLGQH